MFDYTLSEVTVFGLTIDLSSITIPSLVMRTEKDRFSPVLSTTLPLAIMYPSEASDNFGKH